MSCSLRSQTSTSLGVKETQIPLKLEWMESEPARSVLARKTFSAPAEPQATHSVFPSPHLDAFATRQLHTREGSGLDTHQPSKGLLSSDAHKYTPLQCPPPAARPFLPGRHTNTRDAGAGRNPWFFLQLQRCGYTKCLWKDIQNRSNRNRRATETILACSTEEIPCKCLRWIHSSTSLFDSPFFPLPFITRLFVKLMVP